MTTAQTTYRNALKIGTMLQEYRVESVLGVGGFGMTYLCTDTHLEKRVAIKEYFPSDLALNTMQWALSLDEKQRPATVEICKRALEGKTPSPTSVRVASIATGAAPTVTSTAAATATSAATQVRRTSVRSPYEIDSEPSSPWRWW